MTPPLLLSQRARRTKDQPISWFMKAALENPRLISLAAGFVDNESLPCAETLEVCREVLGRPSSGRPALQYGNTPGYDPLREKVLARTLALDGVQAQEIGVTVDDVVLTTGSQQLLYLLGEVLFDPGDIVIAEGPSYFVYHGVLSSMGARVLQVPMDEQGMDTQALEDLLQRLEKTGELERVRLIYTVNCFQNPTGLTLSLPRRRHLLELARRFSRKHRLLILEDAAYRELRFEGTDLPSIKSLDAGNEHVILAMTFSKPLAPGFKTGFGLLPKGLAAPVLRFKGNHDFGSGNLTQHLIDRLLENGAYDRQVRKLAEVYRRKRDVLVGALENEFGADSGVRWTHPEGGFYVWLTFPPGVETGPDSPFMNAALREGVLYIPGEFCYVDEGGVLPRNEARLCFGVADHQQLREGTRRLALAAQEAGILRSAVSV